MDVKIDYKASTILYFQSLTGDNINTYNKLLSIIELLLEHVKDNDPIWERLHKVTLWNE